MVVLSVEVANANIGVNPNWELLTPQGFRFYLPGNSGPAWQDVHTSANINSPVSPVSTVHSLNPSSVSRGRLAVAKRMYRHRPNTSNKNGKYLVIPSKAW